MKKKLILGALLLMMGHASMAQVDSTANGITEKFETYQQALNAGRTSYLAGDKVQALALLKQAAVLAKTPDEKFQALGRVATIYKESEDKTQALATWRQIANIKGMERSNDLLASLAVANLLLSTEDYAKARDAFQPLFNTPDVDDDTYNYARMGYASSYYNEKNYDEALKQAQVMLDDPRINFTFQALAMKLAGRSYDKKGNFPYARESYIDSLDYFEKAIAAGTSRRVETQPVYAALLADYEKEFGRARAEAEALKLVQPLQAKGSELRLAERYKESLGYYAAIDGISPYLPLPYRLVMKEGYGSTMMYTGYWEGAHDTLREVADTPAAPNEPALNTIVQNARRMLALSYKLEGQVKGGAIEFGKSREELNKLFALPNLSAKIAERARENLKELDRLDPQ